MSQHVQPTLAAAGRAADDRYFVASQWQLMWRKFTRHKLAMAAAAVLAVFYLFAAFSEFFAAHDILKHSAEYVFMRPQKVRFGDEHGWGLRPFVYDVQKVVDREAFRRVYVDDPETRHYIRFFVHGDPSTSCGASGRRICACSGSRRGHSTCSAPTSWAATCTRVPFTPAAYRCRSV